jgi:four helix bundle protein
MFDFENLDVYKKTKELNKEVLKFAKENKQIDSYLRDQLRRASISTVINIAEGSGKFSKADKKNFYIISRGSTYE